MVVPIKEISDQTWLIAEPGKSWAHDFYPDREAAQNEADRQELISGVPYLVEQLGAFLERTTRESLEASPLVEITAEFYETQLNQLPPMYRQGAWGWFCCEYTRGSLTQQYVSDGGRFYCALVDVRNPSTWITRERVDAMPKGSPVYAWFGRVWEPENGRDMWAGDLTDSDGPVLGFYLEYDAPRRDTPAARLMVCGDLMSWRDPLADWAFGSAIEKRISLGLTPFGIFGEN